ncbi:MAG: HNH endonuclease [Oscillospiraceae bacterium]|nr:HNH endonuclease [Oscillospiraceae bacterium]
MEFKLNDYHRNITDEELLKDILRVANSLGKTTISQTEYVKNGGKYSSSFIRKRFDGWIKALEKCGLSPNESQRHSAHAYNAPITTQELINDLLRVSKKINKKTFSCVEYRNNGKYSVNSYLRRFITWNNALKAAELEPFDHPLGGKKISEYACLKEIERIWITLGRQPTTSDIENGISKYSLATYKERFGSWRKALEFFVAYMNGEQEVENTDDSDDIQLPIESSPQSVDNELLHKTKRNINLRLRFTVMKRDNFKCCMCGRSPATTLGLELHIDHIIPWSKGGETTIDNLQTLCSDCNIGKSNLSEND